MIHAHAKMFAVCLVGGLALQAQVGDPVPVRYEALGTVEPYDPGSIKRITWGPPGSTWTATFSYPKGWVRSEDWQGADPGVRLVVQAPHGEQQTIPLPLQRHRYALEGVNGEFVGSLDGRSPHLRFPGLRDIHHAEHATLGDWDLWRVIWRVGGCSGDPPMLVLAVLRHRGSGQWTVRLGECQYPPAPDGGESMRATILADGALAFSFWNPEGRNCSIRTGWECFADRDGSLHTKPLKPGYALFTRTGAVATIAETPREAVHLGYQEVAWHLESWTGQGGVAQGFAPSPRRLLTEWDRDGAPILPVEGIQPFFWAAEIYVVPWKGKPTRLKLPEALALLKKGRWDVVLFPLKGHQALAQRLVEHQQDFPHSTPRKAKQPS